MWEFYLTMTRWDGTTYPIYRHKTEHHRFMPMFTEDESWTAYLQKQMEAGNVGHG